MRGKKKREIKEAERKQLQEIQRERHNAEEEQRKSEHSG